MVLPGLIASLLARFKVDKEFGNMGIIMALIGVRRII